MSFGWTTCRCAWLHLFFHEKSGNRTCFRCGFSFFLWSLVRFNCARNSGVDDVSRLQGCEMKAEGLWALSRILHAKWMHHANVFLTSLLNLTLSPCFLDDFPTSLNRWCGPMQAAILHSQNMPCPQFRPQWATNQSGPYMMGRTMNPIPSMTQGTWSGHRFPPAPRFHCYILPQGTYKSLATSRAVAAQNGLAAAGRVCETSEQM